MILESCVLKFCVVSKVNKQAINLVFNSKILKLTLNMFRELHCSAYVA